MGVNVTIQDDTLVGTHDLSYNFFITERDIGSNLATSMLANVQELNTFATVSAESRSLTQLTEDYLQSFNIILYGGWSEVSKLIN